MSARDDLIDVIKPAGAHDYWPQKAADYILESDWLAQVRAEAAAEALTKLATHLDGGTPRAWGFHHPCDPPGKRWEPDEADRALMLAADIAREQAARALADKETP